jgi:hypothetical protein
MKASSKNSRSKESKGTRMSEQNEKAKIKAKEKEGEVLI